MIRSSPHGVCALALATIAVAGIVVAGPDDRTAAFVPFVLVAALVTVVWAGAVRRRDRASYYDRLRASAVADAAQKERLLVAENLHDLVSHRLAAITLQASTEPLLDEAGARRALQDIERNGRAATTDMRRLLKALHATGGTQLTVFSGDASQSEALRDEILTWAYESGLDIQVAEFTVPIHNPEVRRLLFSLVREALSNVARHAGRVRVQLRVHREDDDVRVTIDNDAPAPGHRSTPGGGTGLAMVRRRCRELGGTLTATEVANGFRVEARIPDPVEAQA